MAPVLTIVGATATGKSALALDLAEPLGGEIVNADALQVYRGFDIGTAKPSPEDRRRVAAPPAGHPRSAAAVLGRGVRSPGP